MTTAEWARYAAATDPVVELVFQVLVEQADAGLFCGSAPQVAAASGLTVEAAASALAVLEIVGQIEFELVHGLPGFRLLPEVSEV